MASAIAPVTPNEPNDSYPQHLAALFRASDLGPAGEGGDGT